MRKAILLTLVFISLIILAVKFGSKPIAYFLGIQEKAGLKVVTVPDGADVELDGQPVGKTPFEEHNFEPKEHTLRISSGDKKWQGQVNLTGGTLTIVNRDLSADPTASAGEVMSLNQGQGVVIISSPDGADIEIDSKSVGKTPLQTNLSPGSHYFILSKSGYLKRSINAVVADNYKLTLAVDLALSEVDLSNIPTPVTTATKMVKVANTPTDFLRVRDKPSLAGKEITQVKPGDELVLLEETDSWDRVRLANGTEGYVFKKYVEKVETQAPK